ncbi:MAG TPA: PP2C family protein-serine/threonine phosphatase [Candidatus Eisenbacteria bacterium]|nr:PP2C family protein-serine/threonine phosphatase [Candidatus Eisenbacteria bacterium]
MAASDSTPRAANTSRPRSAGLGFLTMLWRQPLFALPIALFFAALYGRGSGGIIRALQLSLVFAYVIGILLWVLEYFVIPRLPQRPGESNASAVIRISVIYAVTSMFGAALSAYLLHSTVFPGLLGDARSVAVFGMTTLMFGALATGIVLAAIFYRDAIQRAKAEQELDLARRIQRAFLISEFPARPRTEVFAVNVSSKQVSGDFYDVVPVADSILVAIADVSGKGVAAALMSSMLQASLRTQAHAVPSTSDVLLNMNRLLCGGAPTGKFATFFLGRFDEPTLTLHYANAGHNLPLLRRADGSVEALEPSGLLLGIQDEIRLTDSTVQLSPGDCLVLYTDGISEAADSANDLFGEERLARVVAGLAPGLASQQVADAIMAAVRAHLNGVEAGDDMTLVVLRVREQPR